MAARADSKAPSPTEPAELPVRQMIHLKTKEECRLGNETIQVWAVEMPSKHAEGILKVVKDRIEGQDAVDLQHLRRFAKPKSLPKHVLGKRDLIKEMYAIPRAWESTPLSVMQAPSTAVWEYSVPAKPRINHKPQTLYLLICGTNLISLSELHNLLLEYAPFCSSADSWAYPLEIKEVTVPRQAPTSPAQADMWTDNYWPTFYRKTNPFGAHPATIAKAEEDLSHPGYESVGVEEAMILAERAAHETQAMGYGVGPGCTIIERVDNKAEILAVAGDARHKALPSTAGMTDAQDACSGNVMGHAVMRAIGMIGRKRLRVASHPVSSKAAKAERTFENCGLDHDEKARDGFFLDLPVTPLEEEYFAQDNIKPDGYLCLRLEVFLTHEPCIMCSMALVHSRVGKVIFSERMTQTGGLTAEMVSNDTGPVGLGYGLCWRKELNWQFMCWEYAQQEEEKAGKAGKAIPVGNVDHHQATSTASANTNPDQHLALTSAPTSAPAKPTAMLSDDNANVSSFASTHV
ncbi:hypothetical protein BDY17DRAFT_328258 [Neohortaea acidophila]|uniref:Uncharacterized protein n=1 Tax=Neohortaea acidophila TaxID=245834 RepID=A0A6A6PHI4_9PEZI|nr:uncharacterized protein BDY17DRAFT_328258 [Neohortaea acidophila]KAF2478737.1 hypothetical protein BDY17DRAFT_328258 [Neohortaea acidophila]